MSGYPRSGTTLLYRLLAQDPQFAAVRDTGDSAHETAIAVYMNPRADLTAVYRRPWPGWSTVIRDEPGFDRFATRVGRLGFLRHRWEQLLTRLVFRDEEFLRSPLDVDSLYTRGWADPAARLRLRATAMRVSRRRVVLREFLTLYAEQAGAGRVLEKYPYNYCRLPELAAALPGARFVFLVRDPVDVFASMVHRARVELRERVPVGRVSWMVMSADAFVRDWQGSVRAAWAFARYAPGRLLFLRYEDLTSSPSEVVPWLADFLDLDVANLVVPDGSGSQEPDPLRRFPLQSAVPTANAGRWLAELADVDVATIRGGCADALAELGYRAK
nr:sulfotransferase [Micromonospora sp. DSM 115978]